MSAKSTTLITTVRKASLFLPGFRQYPETVSDKDVEMALLLDIINAVCRDMTRYLGSVEQFAETLIATRDNYSSTDGTSVSLTQIDSSTLSAVGINTTWNTSGDDGEAHRGTALVITEDGVDAEDVILRVASVESDTSLTLEAYPFASFTGKTYDFKLHHDRYDLPTDFYDFISAYVEGEVVRNLKFLSPSEFDYMRSMLRGNPYTEGPPRHVTIRQVSNSLYQLELDPFPDDVYGIHITYRKAHSTELSSDDDVVPLADEDIDVLVRGVVAYWQQVKDYQTYGSAYERWQRTDLERWIVFNKKQTDEQQQFTPDDMMRTRRHMPGRRISSDFDRR